MIMTEFEMANNDRIAKTSFAAITSGVEEHRVLRATQCVACQDCQCALLVYCQTWQWQYC